MAQPSSQSQAPEIVLDLSRLLSRISYPTPTGVDRCEMAYARGLLAIAPERLQFGAVHPIGIYGRLPRPAVMRFLDITEERWASRGFSSRLEKTTFFARALMDLRPRRLPRSQQPKRIYLQASPSNLTRPGVIRHILSAEGARFLCLVHDLIPLEYPEYGRPSGHDNHRQRIQTIVNYADGIITNSHATLRSLRPYLDQASRTPICGVAHLGTYCPSTFLRPTAQLRPYFVCIGTIEPRKNHLLLLNMWRRLSEDFGAESIPQLVIIGRRGWENEQIVDMLERCPALRGCVEEYNTMSDKEVTAMLIGARALLLPSFAEGYGMPVTEALGLGVPVICSDLPSLREAGGGIPEFLDPLDGPAWMHAITDFTAASSKRRASQLERLKGWRAPSWNDHLRIVQDVCEELAG